MNGETMLDPPNEHGVAHSMSPERLALDLDLAIPLMVLAPCPQPAAILVGVRPEHKAEDKSRVSDNLKGMWSIKLHIQRRSHGLRARRVLQQAASFQ